MLLSGALFALFMMGFWLYCLTDAILTPSDECRGMPKAAWIAVITLTFIGGAVAWLIVREPLCSPASSLVPAPHPDDPGDRYFRRDRWTDADDAVARHPAGRARPSAPAVPRGPDDDPEFLRALDRAIRGNSQAGGEV
jgi:Phospholipase_D-nuclease N-terminal